MRIRNPAFISMWIRILGVKLMGIHADADQDPDPDHTLKSQKVEFLH